MCELSIPAFECLLTQFADLSEHVYKWKRRQKQIISEKIALGLLIEFHSRLFPITYPRFLLDFQIEFSRAQQLNLQVHNLFQHFNRSDKEPFIMPFVSKSITKRLNLKKLDKINFSRNAFAFRCMPKRNFFTPRSLPSFILHYKAILPK